VWEEDPKWWVHSQNEELKTTWCLLAESRERRESIALAF